MYSIIYINVYIYKFPYVNSLKLSYNINNNLKGGILCYQKRLNFITPSYTIGISSKVKEMENNGIKVINLSIGEPDFNVPNNAKSYGIDSLNKDYTKYDLVPGLKILREEICKKLIEENNCKYSIDEIVVSSGAKNSITNTLLALTDEGDEVLLPKPYWVSYPEMVKLVNAVPIFIDTKKKMTLN